MSSVVRNINLHLICASNLLPKDEMINSFMDTIKELNLNVSNNTLIFGNGKTAKLTIGERIVIHTDSNHIGLIQKQIDLLRELFTKRAFVAQKNYQDQLLEQSYRANRENHDAIELKNIVDQLEMKIAKSEEALKIQQLPSCEALVEELKISAVNKGYEVLQIQNKDNVQLQFVRRQY
jgi:hypothetical protein